MKVVERGTAAKAETLKMFIGGRWVASESGETFAATSPGSGETIASIPKGTRQDAQRAVEAAHRARESMARVGAFERARLLHRVADVMEHRRDDLARWLTLDQGKPYKAEAQGEVSEAIEYFRIAAEDVKRLETSVIPSMSPQKLVFTLRVPRGVYGIITPWNWPLTMATEVIAPGLAGGNTVVWAPASSTSAISVKLMECLAEADLPPGAVNLVTGPGSVMGDEIAGHRLIAGVGFVGSTETGRSVAQRAAGKHIMLELGGNGPIVIFGDADIDRAVEGVIAGCFLCAGQSCTAGERILVQRDFQDAFIERLTDAVNKIQLGDPFDDATTMGPLNNEGVALKMDEHIADALARGANVVTGGHRATSFPTRLFYEATVLRGVSPQMRVSKEETFGPIAPVIPFRDEAEALAIANDSPYGLLGSVYTKDIDRALRFAQQLETGWVNVNESSNYWEAHIPFGGRAGKDSGIGRVGGYRAIEQMTDLKTIIVDVRESSVAVTGTNLPVADVIAEAERITAAARALKVPIKLVGGAAVNLHSRSAREAPLKRKYGDLDFVAASKQRQAAEKLFESLGYQGDRRCNTLNGHQRLLYLDPVNGRQIDIFIDRMRMCHVIELADRLGGDDPCLTPADLLLSKLQVFEVNMKDLVDSIALLLDHPIADHDDDAINGTYL